jgi:hypothetical protein
LCPRHARRTIEAVTWEPFEDDLARGSMDALFEINVKLADIRDHLAFIRRLPEDDELVAEG